MTQPRTLTANFESSINSGTFTDERDDKIYKYVTIGAQTWMAENLNFDVSGSVCYDDDESNCGIYGRLYSWHNVMDGAGASSLNPSGVRGICPAGWHIPSSAEWTVLTDFVGGMPGTNLMATSGCSGGGNGTDKFGFSAMPGGSGLHSGSFRDDAGVRGFWWSATASGIRRITREMTCGESGVKSDPYEAASYRFSLRCVRD
jgi:uncharacterized protein (TIGR02145 family)